MRLHSYNEPDIDWDKPLPKRQQWIFNAIGLFVIASVINTIVDLIKLFL